MVRCRYYNNLVNKSGIILTRGDTSFVKYMTEEQKQKKRDWWNNHPDAKIKLSKQVSDWWKNNPQEKERLKNKRKSKLKIAPKESKICLICGKEFFKKNQGKIQWEKAKFCSRECFKKSGRNKLGKETRNYKHGEEWSGKNSPCWKGGKPKCLDCGKEIGYKQKYCKDCKKNHLKSKEYHLIRESKEFKIFRDCVFTTDDYVCQKCGQKGYKLHPHHILNFSQHPEERFNPNNGITFCEDCHREFHKIYGVQNNTKEQVVEFIKSMI